MKMTECITWMPTNKGIFYYAKWLGLERKRGLIPGKNKRFSLLSFSHAASYSHQTSFSMGTRGCSQRVNRLGHNRDYSVSISEAKSACSVPAPVLSKHRYSFTCYTYILRGLNKKILKTGKGFSQTNTRS